MIPELGKYTGAVLSAYGVSFLFIAIIVWTTLRRSARVRRVLDEMENRRSRDA